MANLTLSIGHFDGLKLYVLVKNCSIYTVAIDQPDSNFYN